LTIELIKVKKSKAFPIAWVKMRHVRERLAAQFNLEDGREPERSSGL